MRRPLHALQPTCPCQVVAHLNCSSPDSNGTLLCPLSTTKIPSSRAYLRDPVKFQPFPDALPSRPVKRVTDAAGLLHGAPQVPQLVMHANELQGQEAGSAAGHVRRPAVPHKGLAGALPSRIILSECQQAALLQRVQASDGVTACLCLPAHRQAQHGPTPTWRPRRSRKQPGATKSTPPRKLTPPSAP